LRKALAVEQSRLPADQAAIVREYLDHNELGLAYEHLEYALDELGSLPTVEAKGVLDEAAQMMRLRA
jgi:hypothetical protein